MRRRLSVSLIGILLLLLTASPGPFAAGITDERGELALALMLRKLASVGTVMHVTAHPDDENNALMAEQSHGEGLRVILATATRGNGGQNEIGPEIFEALGVLRTEELLAAHRFDGAEQRFARAVDFGYSFSIQESFDRWGKDEIVGDYVRLIRTTRPDVMFTMRPDLPGGGQHHQASAVIGLEAYRAAGDPARYPEQLKEGLRPWQPRKIYRVAHYGFPGEPKPVADATLVGFDANGYDPLLGRTWAEIGSQARSMHKCQGFGQLLALPGSAVMRYQLADSALDRPRDTAERTLLDGVNVTLPGLTQYAGETAPADLTSRLKAIASAVKDAEDRLRRSGPDAAAPSLAAGLTATRALRRDLATLGLADGSRYEIDFRLQQTEQKFERALVLAHGLRLEALASDGVVTPGQAIDLTLIAANRGSAPIEMKAVALSGVDGAASCKPVSLATGGVQKCETSLAVPADAIVTEPYWHRVESRDRYEFDADAPFGLPFRPTPFRAAFTLTLSGADVAVDLPVEFRYSGNIFSGEKRSELLVVPALTVQVSPDIAIVPVASSAGPVPTAARSGGDRTREIRVTVTNNAPAAADVEVTLDVPAGWDIEPARATMHLARADEAEVARFAVRPPASLKRGTYPIAAKVSAGGHLWSRGYDVIEYPHIRREHIFSPASVTLHAIDVRLPAGLRVGYVMGVGDQVPPAIEQLGAEVAMLGPDDLASGDLSRFDAIVTGVRAYERRKDLRAYNRRLLDYVRGGGTLLVQYNKFEFNQAQYAPYPAKVSSSRVTDETSPVTVLAPEHPVFNRPNPITSATWSGWVQERGLYFLGERDPRYVDLVELVDPYPENAGPKRGALVEVSVGRGRWVYVGLNLWRQLPAGTEGAYQLLANLLSLGGTEKPAAARR